jgi:hypothetical protein
MMHVNSGSQQRIIPISGELIPNLAFEEWSYNFTTVIWTFFLASTEKKLFQLLKTEIASQEKGDEELEEEGDDWSKNEQDPIRIRSSGSILLFIQFAKNLKKRYQPILIFGWYAYTHVNILFF